MKNKVAILVDGAFFIKKYLFFYQKRYSDITPKQMATIIQSYCVQHISKSSEELYRIFFYDCKPLSKKVTHPTTKKQINLAETETYQIKTKLFSELINQPCLALRLGQLDEGNAEWIIQNEKKRKKFLSGAISIKDLSEQDYVYHAKQKGVDMKIGIDIASLSLKKIVQKIVLISGDSDFIPAAKLARTEGVQITLDSMGNPIKDELREHIDWLVTKLPQYSKEISSKK